ncbi:DUF3348 domain-containing protein [Allopusillimonas soli]|uniref:DUF3348 domain-containing protein n=1 Tax=Allopusillimonas soli TaxID=659016 RepID=A0A853FDY0_9BURK|nr:DUF3348 domain-containing protein [Allopusillimonas soli]NYT37030.1 DUF3348 domain-containing protein [Allopusillimonas soli]
MVQELPQRTGFGGPALIRLLVRLTDTDVQASRQPLSRQLSQWLDWSDAIGLSTVLNGPPPAVQAGGLGDDPAREAATEYDQLRDKLEKAILGQDASPATRRQRVYRRSVIAADGKPAAPIEYPAFRQRYVSLQERMETSISNLRIRLRAVLAARSPTMARLALVDAAMEQALGGREQRLLLKVPALLESHFEHLRDAATDAQHGGEGRDATSTAPVPWQDVFRRDMQRVLLAELDIRLKPIEGLIAALRTC